MARVWKYKKARSTRKEQKMEETQKLMTVEDGKKKHNTA